MSQLLINVSRVGGGERTERKINYVTGNIVIRHKRNLRVATRHTLYHKLDHYFFAFLPKVRKEELLHDLNIG